jgi:hypothetical protein
MSKSVRKTAGSNRVPKKAKVKTVASCNRSMNDLILIAHSFHNDTFHEAIGWSRTDGVLTWVNQAKGCEQQMRAMNAGDAVRWLHEMHEIAHRFGLQETYSYDGRLEFLNRVWSQLIHVDISNPHDKEFCRPLVWRPEWLIGKKAFAALLAKAKKGMRRP